MYKYFLFFLLGSAFCCAQGTIIISRDFQQQTLSHSLQYYKDSLNIGSKQSIQAKEFKPFTNTFPGLTNTKFWFKLLIENKEKNSRALVYKINTISFENLIIYVKSETGLEEVFTFKEKMKKNIEVPILLNPGKIEEYYFQVDFVKSIYFPFEIVTEEQNFKDNTTRLIELGLYYGFTLMVLLINLFFYVNTKDKFFLYYCFLLVSITFILAELDGLFYALVGNSNLIRHVDIILHLSLLISLILFTVNALSLKNYYPKLKYLGVSIILINFLVFVVYVITDRLLWYSIGEGINVVGLVMFCIPGILLLKKEMYARYIILGYSLLFFSNILYVLPSEFGLIDMGFTASYFKIGSVFEMIVFLYAISYRHKKVSLAKEKLHGDLLEQKNKEEVLDKSSEEYFNSFCSYFLLSAREIEVARYILQGKMNKEIAYQLEIQETTIKYHVSNILKKLKIQNRTELSYKFAHFNTVNKGVTET